MNEKITIRCIYCFGAGREIITTPIITFGKCVPEIEENNAGIACDRDVDSIHDSLKKILDNDLRKKLSANCIRLARENYSWDQVAKKTLEFVL